MTAANAYGLKPSTNSNGKTYTPELPGIGINAGYAGRTLADPVTVAAGEPLPADCISCSWRRDLADGSRTLKYVSSGCPAHGELPWVPWQAMPVGRGGRLTNFA